MPLELTGKPFDAQAWSRFLELGLPEKGSEAYRYVHLKALLEETYSLPQPTTPSVTPKEGQLVFINGVFQDKLSVAPHSLIALPLSKAYKTYGTFLTPRMGKLLDEERDPFAALNYAYAQESLFLYLPPKSTCQGVRIFNIVEKTEGPTLISPRIHICMGKEASLHLIYEQVATHPSVWVNGYIDCALDERATLTLECHSQQSPESHDFLAVRSTLKKQSSFTALSATNGALTSRHDYVVRLMGEEAHAALKGMWSLSGHQQHHVHVLMDHVEPFGTSLQHFKGVVKESARSSFEGKIYVHPKAQKTEAFQRSNNLILGENASANCKPNLEIFADDVKASHGATIGRLDEEHLFYLKSRAIPYPQAHALLVHGFLREIIDQFTDSEMRKKVLELML